MPGNTPIFDFGCTGTAHARNCGAGPSLPCADFKTWVESVSNGVSIGATSVSPFHTNACGPLPSATVSSDNRYSPRVAGRILAGGQVDACGIDENRTIYNCNNGLN